MSLTANERKIILELFLSGKNIKAITKALGKSSDDNVAEVQNYLYNKRLIKHKLYTKRGELGATDDDILSLYDSGLSYKEIGELCGVSPLSVKSELGYMLNRKASRDREAYENSDEYKRKVTQTQINEILQFRRTMTEEKLETLLITMATSESSSEREKIKKALILLTDNERAKRYVGTKYPDLVAQLDTVIFNRPSWFNERFMQALNVKAALDSKGSSNVLDYLKGDRDGFRRGYNIGRNRR